MFYATKFAASIIEFISFPFLVRSTYFGPMYCTVTAFEVIQA